jgi:superfamily II DNA helicase RecQ
VSGDNKDLYRRVAVGDYQYGKKSLDRPNIFYSVGKKSGLTVSFQNCYTKQTVITHLQIDRLT